MKIKYLFIPLLIGSLLFSGCGTGSKPRGNSPALNGSYEPNYLPSIGFVRPWQVKDITYKITGGDSSIPGINQPQRAREGIKDWNPTLKDLLTTKEVGENDYADVNVSFVGKGGFSNSDYIGETIFTYVGGDLQWKVEIKIYRGLDPIVQKKVATHEFGHSLGVLQHSNFIPSIMYPTVYITNYITKEDHNTMRKIYDPSGSGNRLVGAPTYPVGSSFSVCHLTPDDVK